MKKIALLSVFSLCLNVFSLSFASPDHFLVWGDEEGVIKRSGADINEKNKALPVLRKLIDEVDKEDKIDALLHTGDFVRFDPSPKYYQDFLGNKLNKFYPTIGGDQENYLGRYYSFMKSTSHLKELFLDRVKEDKNGLEYYYHAIVKNTHIISLHSPDEYREHEKNPEFIHHDLYTNKEAQQYKWLELLLHRIRSNSEQPIIVLAHRPIFNNSKSLVDLFSKYKVNLVLSGDVHVFAHKYYKGVHYFVTGIMGDKYAGGCIYLNKSKDDYIENYDSCLPKNGSVRKIGEKFIFNNDHYLDVKIDNNFLRVKAIDIEKKKQILYK